MAEHNRRKFLRSASSATACAAILQSLRNFECFTDAAVSPSKPDNQQPPSGPALKDPAIIRGVMVDAARVPETLEYYRRLIGFCADWQLNTIHLRLTDDQGSALRFASVPGLFTHHHAFTPDQLKELAHFAFTHGVDLIPEIESFGHTGFITRSASYAHLLDAPPGSSSDFTGVIPMHPETLHLFGKLYREVADIFPSSYLHGGCDEVAWGGSAISKQALRSKSRPEIWAEYLNTLNRIAEGTGKRFIVWGDFVLHKEPAILTKLSKNIIVMDWNYWDTNPDKFLDALEKVKDHGARAIGAPGLISYRWGARAGTNQLGNIDAFAQAYLGTKDSGSLGVILTNWVPSRYLQNSLWDGFAYVAVALNEGATTARSSAFRRFVEKHYASEWSEDWSEAFRIIYDAAPGFGEDSGAGGTGLKMPIPWSTDAELEASLSKRTAHANPFTHLRDLTLSLEGSIHANPSDFRAFALCVEYLHEVFWRESIIQERAGGSPLHRAEAIALIREIAERDHALATALSNDWDTGRFPDSSAKAKPLFGMHAKDQLVFQLTRAAEYSAALSQYPDRFLQLLKSSGLSLVSSTARQMECV